MYQAAPGNTWLSHDPDYEGQALESMLVPYTGVKADRATEVGGQIFMCPASGFSKILWTNGTWKYVIYDYGANPIGSGNRNSYSGLFYNYTGDPGIWDPNDPTIGSVNLAQETAWLKGQHSWRPYAFTPPQWWAQTPVQFCSMKGNSPDGNVTNASWHYPYGRPTSFLDGHVAILKKTLYQGNYQNLFLSNIAPVIDSWVDTTYLGNAKPFALSEW